METKPRLVLITEEFPYGTGENFILNFCLTARQIFSITIMPSRPIKNLDLQEDRFDVDLSLVKILNMPARIFFHGLISIFIRLMTNKKFRTSFRPHNVIQNISEIGRARLTRRHFLKQLSSCDPPDLVFSWWTLGTSLGAAEAARWNACVSVSGIWGHDFVSERGGRRYLAWLSDSLESQDLVISNSDWARDYVYTNSLNSSAAMRIEKYYLGCEKRFDGLNKKPPNDRLAFVSCSTSSPVKRVEKIHELLSHVAYLLPTKEISWTHVGGVSQERLESFRTGSPANLSFRSMGSLPNSDIHRLYVSDHFTAFIHLSESEGGVPVAIQEALAYGIPLIGFSAGGVTEAVQISGGVLLDSDDMATNSGKVIRECLDHNFTRKRDLAFYAWSEYFDSTKTMRELTNNLRKLL